MLVTMLFFKLDSSERTFCVRIFQGWVTELKFFIYSFQRSRDGALYFNLYTTFPNEICKNLCEKNTCKRVAFDSAKNHKRQRRKRQSVTAKQEKSQTPKFV